MVIDDKFDRKPYKPLGLPALVRMEKRAMAEEHARLMRARASMYSSADHPELYQAVAKAEERVKSYK